MSARSDVPADQLRAGGAERLDRAEIPRTIDDHGVAGIDEAARQQIQPLLRAAEDQHALGRNAEALGDGVAKHRLPFRRAMPPHRPSLTLDRLIDGVLKRRHGKAVDRRFSGRQREHFRVGRVPDRVAQDRVARSQRRGGNLAAPGERRAGGIGRGADERAAADIPAQQAARFELAVGADDGGAQMPSRCASSRSGGTRAPDGKSPREMADSSRPTRWL